MGMPGKCRLDGKLVSSMSLLLSWVAEAWSAVLRGILRLNLDSSAEIGERCLPWELGLKVWGATCRAWICCPGSSFIMSFQISPFLWFTQLSGLATYTCGISSYSFGLIPPVLSSPDSATKLISDSSQNYMSGVEKTTSALRIWKNVWKMLPSGK